MKSDEELLLIILGMADIQAHDVVGLPADFFRDDERLTAREFVRLCELCKNISFTVILKED